MRSLDRSSSRYQTAIAKSVKRGFTLIELLTVMAIIAVLVAMLLPAILQARESVRRSHCLNNLRQLGIALHNFHSSNNRFPKGTENEWSWNAQILPMLEESALYSKYNPNLEPFDAAHAHIVESVVPSFVCPSDGKGDWLYESTTLAGLRFAHTNYFGSLEDDNESRGMFGEYESVSVKEVEDGTSKTLFVGERGVVVIPEFQSHGWWVWGPETVISANNEFSQGEESDPESAIHWWSYHDDGANFLFVDGSVRRLSYSIEPTLFKALGTKDGRESVSDF